MKIVRVLCRIIFSLTFILSGVLKLIDPVGTGLKVLEYLNLFHLDFLSGAQVWIGIALACAEFVIGTSVLVGMKMRFISGAALALISFFTLLSLYLVIYEPIEDCGCFGDAVHLTAFETFSKNIVLLAMALPIFLGRRKCTQIAPDWLQWCFLALFTVAALSLALYEKNTIPHIDFSAYSPGVDLNDVYAEDQAEFETVFIYEKDGKRAEFTLDNLPDSSWTYVDTVTELTDGDTYMAQIDFQPHTLEGKFFAVTVYDRDILFDEDFSADLEYFRCMASDAGVEAALYTPQGREGEYPSDRKSLMTINRSNGGVTYIADGVIVRKWPRADMPEIDVAQVTGEDPDVVILKQRIASQLFASILIAGWFAILLLVRYFCRMFLSDDIKTESKENGR